MKTFPVMTEKEARRDGYRSLTTPYHIQHKDPSTRLQERDWWHRVCKDLQCCNCVVVEYQSGVELWRHENEMDIDQQTGVKINAYVPKVPKKNEQN